MKYKCLVLDHDDTTVNSTPCIHYPAFLKILEEIRPGKQYSREEFLLRNFTPGLGKFYVEELGFTPEELRREWEIWRGFVSGVTPEFFPGMPELIKKHKNAGGTLCVVSHSFTDYILRDYRAAGVPEPDLIYGWNEDRSKCKPSPWPLEEIMRITGFGPEEILMVDDLKQGMEMAHRCGAAFAACFWSYDIPGIREYMEQHAEYCLDSVEDLDRLLYGEAD